MSVIILYSMQQNLTNYGDKISRYFTTWEGTRIAARDATYYGKTNTSLKKVKVATAVAVFRDNLQ